MRPAMTRHPRRGPGTSMLQIATGQTSLMWNCQWFQRAMRSHADKKCACATWRWDARPRMPKIECSLLKWLRVSPWIRIYPRGKLIPITDSSNGDLCVARHLYDDYITTKKMLWSEIRMRHSVPNTLILWPRVFKATSFAPLFRDMFQRSIPRAYGFLNSWHS